MVVFLGKGYALWRGVVGPCPGCPERGGGGKGVSGTQLPVTCLSWGGYRVPPWSDLMIRVGRPWNPQLLLMGPGPSSRSNSIVIRMRHRLNCCFSHKYRVENKCNGRNLDMLPNLEVF
jgi:hypothetical protein